MAPALLRPTAAQSCRSAFRFITPTARPWNAVHARGTKGTPIAAQPHAGRETNAARRCSTQTILAEITSRKLAKSVRAKTTKQAKRVFPP